MRIDIAAQTDIGRRKRNNEDNYGVFREDTPGLQLFREGALLCVADGLGGHSSGEVASKLAVSHAKDMLREDPPPSSSDPEDEGPIPLMRQYIAAANDSIFQTNQELVQKGKPMGTTLLAALVQPRKVYIGNVGDSRCYHIRDGEIVSRTEDHSWVDEQVKLGLMSKAEAEVDQRRHMVTRSIGTHPEVGVDTYVWHVVPGDMIMLCTDGLINMVKDSEILEVFRTKAGPADIVHTLINMANENGGKDNITVIVADISPKFGAVVRRGWMRFIRRRGSLLVMLLIGLIWGGLCFAAGYYLGQTGLPTP